ncbi:TniB family NTP-binding protein [uncultured Tateyamaria sp.]|uniref:TniB family NTP-binding protein n=1 Tax=uncultured Tateyamaria sp. TaxID=455651 RepID=UPI002631BB05|nr:TniB family NTP-binding protein [uncultured Tateyamaria sp.]
MTLKKQKALATGQIISDLCAKFVPHTPFSDLQDQFDLLLYRRRAELAAGRSSKARGIVLIGNSGSGKSTAMTHLFNRHGDLERLEPNKTKAEVISLAVPSPATLKHVGMSCLNAIGYPIRRDRTSGIIWELLQNHLRERETLFLHLDEAQDLHINRNEREVQSVVNTLKSLMQNPSWPTGLILSGMPALKDLLHLDPQLSRRFVPIHLAPISFTTHGNMLMEIIANYLDAAKLPMADGTYNSEFTKRLIHAGAGELGLVIEIIIAAIEEALLADDTSVGLDNFIAAFRRRSGCVDDLNPFISEDFRAVDARKLLAEVEEEEPDVLMPNARKRRRAA